LDANGGTGPAQGGEGGDGRVRVDGLRSGTTTIEGLAGGYVGSEYVGPSITQFNSTHVIGRGNATSTFEAKIWNGTQFNSFTTTSDVNGDYVIPVIFDAPDNFVTVIQNTTNTVFVMSPAAAVIFYKRTMEDSAAVDDEISFFKFTTVFRNVDDDSALVDDFITFKVKDSSFFQPDAGAPGMNVAVQFIADGYTETSTVTTNSPDIVVGPTIVTDENGDVVAAGGRVLTAMFFINITAAPQTVAVTIDGKELTRTFEIQIPDANSGDYIGQGAGPFDLGDNTGRNGNRTVG